MSRCRRVAARLLLAFSAALAAAPSAAGATDAGAWYLLEFAAHPPRCDDAAANVRCRETRTRTSRFEIRDGERLEISAGSSAPPSWVIVQNLWTWAPGVAGRGLSITVDRTPTGLRLSMSSTDINLIQTLPLGEWVELSNGLGPRFWARATAY